MFCTSNIEVITTKHEQYKQFELKWSFGGNSSIISLFNNGEPVFTSEHWITDCSDYLSFDKNNELVSLSMSIPNDNEHLNFHVKNTICGKLILRDGNNIVEPTRKRFFDSKNKKLYCFTMVQLHTKFSIVKLHRNFSLILSDGVYMGFIVDDPIKFLADERYGLIDTDNEPDDYEYSIMTKFMDIMSDNRLGVLNGDMSILVNELYTQINPKIQMIQSKLRRQVIKSSLDDLLDFYS